MNRTDAKIQSFPKFNRIRKKKEYSFLHNQAKKIKCSWGSVWVALNFLTDTRLGLSISKVVGNSVIRNRMKRLVRAWFRIRAKLVWLGLDIVVQLTRAATVIKSDVLFDELDKAVFIAATNLKRQSEESK